VGDKKGSLSVGAVPFILAGCSGGEMFHTSTPADVSRGSPLGPSYVLVPLPNEDQSLLGRVLLKPLEDGRSLDEVSRPNECASKLTGPKEGPLASTFEDAQELAQGAKARATLATFGFEGDAQTASHFYYKLDVSKRSSQSDTTDYVACCKEKNACGYGFVSALIYGEGEYATAAESSAQGSVSIPAIGGAGGFVKAKVLHKRKVRGYVAAVVTVTDPRATKEIGVLGDPAAAGITVDEQNLPEQVKARFEAAKIRVAPIDAKEVAMLGPTNVETAYVFRDGNGEITENEFVRRYASMTDDMSLSPAERHRRTTAMIIYGGGTAVSLGAFVYGITNLERACTGSDLKENAFRDDPQARADCLVSSNHPNAVLGEGGYYDPTKKTLNLAGVLAAALGGAATAAFGTFFTIALVSRDGGSHHHSISKFDADLYAAKYNRALLRRTVKETESQMRRLSADLGGVKIKPVLSPSLVGLTGTF
jgi:hypothetical protein